MNEKGRINTTTMDDMQKLNILNEFVEKAEKDSLNLREAEIQAAKDIINYLTIKQSRVEYMKSILTAVQKEKIINKYLSKDRKEQMLNEVI